MGPRVPFSNPSGCIADGPPASPRLRSNVAPEGIRGTFEVAVIDEVTATCPRYAFSPPAGGPYAEIWASCGFYTTPLSLPQAMHSMRNGAVWIAYGPSIGPSELSVVRATATRASQILASPEAGLGAPVVLTAWGRQLWLNAVEDPRFDEFITAYVHGPQRPTRDESCRDGQGEPEETFWG